MELWVPVKGFSDYEVSSNGRIRNVKTGRILKTTINNRGYVSVCLRKDKVQYAKRVHRLVAESFYDVDREDLDVNHLDGDKTNNHVSNLEWCSRSENIRHAFKTGLKVPSRRKRIRNVETGVVYDSIHECARQMGVDASQIRICLTKDWYTCKGYHFEEA